ncbi:hypothetical protein BA059_15240 [Mycolicibacterium sp. (ex Dasyatis americana)]|nr:hypothetical protein BA059_15240 [Mycolicibacterium sp. (ex Dasyatis americana)]
MQIAIVRKGIEDLTGVIEQTRTDQSAIAARLEGIAKDYATLVPRRAGRDDIQNITGENEKPDDESIESQVARWYVDWRMLEHEIATHNAGVAAFNSRKPPPGSPAPVVAAWNAERLRWNAEAEALHLRQMQLYSEGILLNIPVEQPDEPVLIDAPFQIPGTAPSGFNAMTPATVTTTKVHTVGP